MKRIFLVILILLSGCATNPVSKSSDFVLMSEADELALGQKAAAEVEKQMTLVPEDDPLSRYVDHVGQKVAAVSDRPELFYRFRIVDDATINAFALPGGYIYIHRGLLNHMNSEAELAAVLGHEIGHVTARHAVKQYSQAQAYQLGAIITSIFVPIPYGVMEISNLLATAIISGYGRDAELQSDELSLKYIARAGYDPHATIGILETLKRLDDLDTKERTDAGEEVEKYHGAFASHPETEQRIREAVEKATSIQQGSGIIGHEIMLHHLDGYPYGDSAEQGAIVEQRFLHPKLGIQLHFPESWVLTNTPSSLNARIRKKKVFFQMTLKELRKKHSPKELLEQMFPHKKHTAIRTGTQYGYKTAHTVIQMSAPHVSQATVDARIFMKGPRAYLLLMWEERSKYPAHQRDFDAIAKSFRPYDVKKDGDIPRIVLHQWKRGDSWQLLAKKSHMILGRFTAEKIAALNGMGTQAIPAGGTLIKTVR